MARTLESNKAKLLQEEDVDLNFRKMFGPCCVEIRCSRTHTCCAQTHTDTLEQTNEGMIWDILNSDEKCVLSVLINVPRG